MLVIPAIDLRDGACVRLLQGRFDAVTQYGDPFVQVRRFAEAGAQWVHIVDLDGARARKPAQVDLIGRLAAETNLKVQSGGGVRSREDVEALLAAGVDRVVTGSVAVRAPQEVRQWIDAFGVERICVALDVRQTQEAFEVAADGWAANGGATLEQALSAYPPNALKHVLVTDISRDGALDGPNTALMQYIRRIRADLALQASGGVASLDDLAVLKAADVSATIVGRALYEQRFTVEAALAV